MTALKERGARHRFARSFSVPADGKAKAKDKKEKTNSKESSLLATLNV
ncbi:hypothetical protein ACH4HG_36145 [Streptomyces coeruleorubidus]